jgi:hypothetical protein
MSASDMADAVIAEYQGVTNSVQWETGERAPPLAYVEAFARGLTGYVETNMEIAYSWAATLPPPASTPDPVTSFVSKLKIADKTIGQPPALVAWGPLIMACFAKAETEHPSALLVEKGKLKIITLTLTPPPAAFPGPIIGICQQIYTWLLACTNPAPLSGTHGPYSGTTTAMVIA